MMARNNHFGALAAATGVLVAAGMLMLIMVALVEPVGAAFPGTNGKIAFASDRDGDPEIYTMNQDGSGLRKLTNNQSSDEAPAFSRSAQKIAFSSTRNGNNEIYVLDANGSNHINLTNNPASILQANRRILLPRTPVNRDS